MLLEITIFAHIICVYEKMKVRPFSLFCLFLAFLLTACDFLPGKTLKILGKEHSVASDTLEISPDTLESNEVDEEVLEENEKERFLVENIKIENESHLFLLDSLGRKVRRKALQDSLRQEYDKEEKYVYLTFDDGPLTGSHHVSQVATDKGVKISAFLIGVHALNRLGREYLNVYKENSLVECYNHSYTHADLRYKLFYSNPEKAYHDFLKNHEELDLDYKIVRLPGRNVWAFDDVRVLDNIQSGFTADSLHNNGFKVFGWDLEWKLNQTTGISDLPVEVLFDRIKTLMDSKKSLYPNNVVLLTHDNMFMSEYGKQQLEELIAMIQEKTDYKFEHMSKYPVRF